MAGLGPEGPGSLQPHRPLSSPKHGEDRGVCWGTSVPDAMGELAPRAAQQHVG